MGGDDQTGPNDGLAVVWVITYKSYKVIKVIVYYSGYLLIFLI